MALKLIRKVVKMYFTLMYVLPVLLAVLRTVQHFRQEKMQKEEQ